MKSFPSPKGEAWKKTDIDSDSENTGIGLSLTFELRLKVKREVVGYLNSMVEILDWIKDHPDLIGEDEGHQELRHHGCEDVG